MVCRISSDCFSGKNHMLVSKVSASIAVVLSVTWLVHAAPAAETLQQPCRFAVPSMIVAPLIDGSITGKEWNDATQIVGFMEAGRFLEPREGARYIGYDANNVYVAMTTELPPNKRLIARVTPHDANTVHDDSIELWIDPNRQNRLDEKGDRRYYQLILNSLGNLLDVVFDPDKGPPNSGWGVKLLVGSQL